MDFIVEHKKIILIIFVLLWVVMSFITFLMYKIDKSKAQNHKWRIKEATLLTLPWLFGSIGGILGMYALRHKTKHWYFVINDFLALIVYIVLFVLLLILK